MRSRVGSSSRGGDEIDVEPAVAVVVEQRDAAAARFQDVVLGRPSTLGARRQTRVFFELDGRRLAAVVVWRRGADGAGPMAEAWPPTTGSLGFALAVAALEGQAERDRALELDAHALEQRQDGPDVRSRLGIGSSRGGEFLCLLLQLSLEGRCELLCCRKGLESLAGAEQRTSGVVGWVSSDRAARVSRVTASRWRPARPARSAPSASDGAGG